MFRAVCEHLISSSAADWLVTTLALIISATNLLHCINDLFAEFAKLKNNLAKLFSKQKRYNRKNCRKRKKRHKKSRR
ncbi:hypothetical protein O2U01_11145 (plasmid) [Ligilactobacillus salivarius]|uniref:Uncharacterized protein n=2 Tax=Ligilactobacillus salivarius TaxID=1624 RepID=A0A089QGS0_9LACO|nr:hypothetical protein [Ligilactobacillus salivarius]AIR11870.1 Hypothetical protein LSJ_4093 [Ligilactobacillus salivarius]WHS05243.1 hypothetical protein O2U07_01165 [Ligilactobacillus salivarius]WHS07166.1 hypothetical protein O2U05_00080 [Ligilactobacillus salivarius]WHS11014.1 hypothetical protein O2U04_10190 [Ligilactobacillus salivarius]WHS15290.1 hypothetical protein O2U03_11045 [Ligilactobacillus salivarius]